MTELDAARWLQNQAGLIITIKKGGVELFLQGQVLVEGENFLSAVIALQGVLREMEISEKNSVKTSCHY